LVEEASATQQENAFKRLASGQAAFGETMSNTKQIGSRFEEFLQEEGLHEDAQAVAIKRVLAFQLAQLMKQQSLTKVELAKRMNTSRAALDRLLDPRNSSVTLHTLHNAAKAVGGELKIVLEVPGT
jgi:antitoxin HicB